MVTIKAYEFKDLSKEVQLKKWETEVDAITHLNIDFLNQDLDSNEITEEQFYEELGCTKYYAESTSWFVPSCYYEKHRTDVNREVKETLNINIYDRFGNFIIV